jgi:hypothetical protein
MQNVPLRTFYTTLVIFQNLAFWPHRFYPKWHFLSVPFYFLALLENAENETKRHRRRRIM